MEEKLLAQLEEKNEWIYQLETSLAESESELIDLQERLQDLEWMLEEMRASTSYRVALQFARAAALLAPPGTVRRRFLRLGAGLAIGAQVAEPAAGRTQGEDGIEPLSR